jgi:hypothetical protein
VSGSGRMAGYSEGSAMFQKIRFTAGRRATAGLVLPAEAAMDRSPVALSRFFPMTEAAAMHRLERSPLFNTWDEAFRYVFPD